MEVNKGQQAFRYLLQGKYSKGSRGKGGKSREIFIPKHLLKLYKSYFEQERPPSGVDNLLVNNSVNAYGAPIKQNKGSDVFAGTRKIIIVKQSNGKEATAQPRKDNEDRR